MGVENCCWRIITWISCEDQISSHPVQQCFMQRGRFPVQFAPWLSQCWESTAAHTYRPGCQSKSMLRGEERKSAGFISKPIAIWLLTLLKLLHSHYLLCACVYLCKQELCALNLLQYLGQGEVVPGSFFGLRAWVFVFCFLPPDAL